MGQEPQTNTTIFGPCVANGITSGTSTAWTMARFMAANEGWAVQEVTLGGALISTLVSTAETGVAVGAELCYARILNDGTDLFYQVSADGLYWRTYFVAATPASLAYYGILCGNGAANGANSAGRLVGLPTPTLPTQIAISNVVSTTLLTFTTTTPHGLSTGFGVSIRGITWSGGTAPNGIYESYGGSNFENIIVTGPNTFTLPGTESGSYVSGGTVTALGI